MIRALFTLSLLAHLDACFSFPDHVWNQKTTLTVETPNGPVSGSGVIEVTAWFYDPPDPMTGREVHYEYRGEAAAVEVLPGQWLFALIGNPAEMIYHASPDALGGIDRGDRGAWLAAIPDHEGAVTLTGRTLPRLVTFADIDDPASVALVDPENLAASFGPGVRLTSVTLEVTEEPVTEGRVEEVLDWWLTLRSGPYTSLSSLQLPDDSPRGWQHLSPTEFWSLDRLNSLEERTE